MQSYILAYYIFPILLLNVIVSKALPFENNSIIVGPNVPIIRAPVMPKTNQTVFMAQFIQGDQNIRPIKDCTPYSEVETVFRGSRCHRRRHPQDFMTSCKRPSQVGRKPDKFQPYNRADYVYFDKCHDDEFCIDGKAPHSPNRHSENQWLETGYCISSPAFVRFDNDRSGKKHTFVNSITGDLAHTPQKYTFQAILAGASNSDTFFAHSFRLKVNDKLGNELAQRVCKTEDDNHKCRHIEINSWPDNWDHFTTEIRFPKKRGPTSVGVFWAVVEMGTGFEEFGSP